MSLPQRFLILSAAGTAFLAGLFLTVLRREDATVQNSLIDLSILPPLPPRAVLKDTGTLLPPVLLSRTLTLQESPYLLSGTVKIPAGHTVRAERGTVILAAQGSRLVVEGSLLTTGTALSGNALHPDHRLWHGLVVRRGGRIEALESIVTGASAAITCAAGGTVDLRGGTLSDNAAGIVTLPGSTRCRLQAVTLQNGRVGIFNLGSRTEIVSVVFKHLRDELRAPQKPV